MPVGLARMSIPRPAPFHTHPIVGDEPSASCRAKLSLLALMISVLFLLCVFCICQHTTAKCKAPQKLQKPSLSFLPFFFTVHSVRRLRAHLRKAVLKPRAPNIDRRRQVGRAVLRQCARPHTSPSDIYARQATRHRKRVRKDLCRSCPPVCLPLSTPFTGFPCSYFRSFS